MLDDYRNQIDLFDQELTALFEKRMDVVLKVADYKKQNQLEILNQNREDEVLKKVINQLDNKDYIKEAQDFFQNLMDTSKALQQRKHQEDDLLEHLTEGAKLGIPGTQGSFSEEAAQHFFSEKFDLIHPSFYPSFAQVMTALQAGTIDLAIMPVQNIMVGQVTETAALLARYACKIITYTTIKIAHHLLALPGTDWQKVQEVISHPQALAQCSRLITSMGYTPVDYTSTSTAARWIAETGDSTKAAIASKKAAALFGLEVIKSDIADNLDNYTQFVILKRDEVH